MLCQTREWAVWNRKKKGGWALDRIFAGRKKCSSRCTWSPSRAAPQSRCCRFHREVTKKKGFYEETDWRQQIWEKMLKFSAVWRAKFTKKKWDTGFGLVRTEEEAQGSCIENERERDSDLARIWGQAAAGSVVFATGERDLLPLSSQEKKRVRSYCGRKGFGLWFATERRRFSRFFEWLRRGGRSASCRRSPLLQDHRRGATAGHCCGWSAGCRRKRTIDLFCLDLLVLV